MLIEIGPNLAEALKPVLGGLGVAIAVGGIILVFVALWRWGEK